MRKIAICILLFIAFGAAKAAAGKPQIQIPEKHWEFGLMPQDARVHHGYWIKNIGDDTLRIVSVKPG
jgi:hypothetical protein